MLFPVTSVKAPKAHLDSDHKFQNMNMLNLNPLSSFAAVKLLAPSLLGGRLLCSALYQVYVKVIELAVV